MFGLISKLAEILSSYWGRFLDGKRLDQDTDVASYLVRLIEALQDLCVRGQQLLALAERLLDGGSPETSAEFGRLLGAQAQAVDGLQSVLGESRMLLATVDARFYLDLAPLVDSKSGLLARWGRQATLGRFSTTTLFFLPADDLARLLEAGQACASPDGLLAAERTTWVVAVADGIRDIRSREVRDIRFAAVGAEEQVRADIASARADLKRAEEYCSTLLGATETAVGPEAMARLRRKLLRQGGYRR
jgi:hypothetical protein